MANFYILEMDDDRKIIMLLGMAFLDIVDAHIDMQKGKLKMQVKNEEDTFGI